MDGHSLQSRIGRKRTSTLKRELFVKKPCIFDKIHLGRNKFVSITTYQNQTYLHLRVFEDNLPAKKGIALCPIRARTLLDAVYTIDAEAEFAWSTKSQTDQPEHFVHLGFGTFLRLYKLNFTIFAVTGNLKELLSPPSLDCV
jgi:hypothetical protein